ncbi:hypothetical protein [Actinomadura rudentiformis]|uniref:Uncharacterized protein n=1 Tax=Actinomadura rudentiformis TaxID=359158 RepID=A0A6H9YNY7_9ACTN|nr:hypothetical protein [Actinomadura rudentiformis]KAB2345197.1 hypothetical protein F8566_28430 [Actinomadura rudentiformis]
MVVPEPGRQRSARRTLLAVVAALFAAILAYKILKAGGLEQTALFYVGIPALIALTVVQTARPRSTLGTIMATITVGLALAGPLLGEGVVCLIIAAPLFYLVGAFVGLFADWAGRRRGMQALLIVPLLLAAEGTAVGLPRGGEVTVTRTAAAGTDVERSVAAAPEFGPVRSRLLRLKFPKPVRSDGTGLDIGATRLITFTPRKSLGIDARPEPRTMELKVVRRETGRVVFAITKDTTLARWLELREAEFSWHSARLSVTLRYSRTFDPAWYFSPVQQHAMRDAAAYLAETFTAP